MARRDETEYSENEPNRYQSDDFCSQELKRLDAKTRARTLRNEHESPRSDGSYHGRDSGRKHSSPTENIYFRQKTTVARKSSRRGSQPDRYVPSGATRDQVPFRGPSQSKLIGQRRHTPRELSQPRQVSLELSPARKVSIDWRSMHQMDFNTKTESNRLGIVNVRSGRANDQTRWARDNDVEIMEDSATKNIMDRQTRKKMGDSSSREHMPESSVREHLMRDNFVHRPRFKSPPIIDELDSMGHRLRNKSPIAETAQPSTSAPTIYLNRDWWNHQDQHKADNQHQSFSLLTQSESLTPNPSRRESLPRLIFPPASLRNTSNHDSVDLVTPGKLTNGTDAITPISTSAMSISSGSTPPQSSSSSRKNPHHQKTNACIMCKNPQVPVIDLLVRCNQCFARYHTSCHNPKITCTKGDLDVDVGIWKCQRCVKRSGNSLQATEMPNLTAKLPHSTESSESSSEGSTTQISLAIDSLKLTGRGSSASDASSRADHHSELDAERPTRRSRRLRGNLHSHGVIDPRYHDGASDFDVGPPRKRLKSNTAEPYYHIKQQSRVVNGHNSVQNMQQTRRNGDSQPIISGTLSRTFERFEQDRQNGDLSRSSSIFSENRKLAVVIDNRSRSASASTNGKKGYQETNNWFQTPTTVKDSQETPTLISKTHYQTSSQNRPVPVSYQDSQPIIIGSDNDEIPSPPRGRRRALLSEVKNSQETEGELTDAPMSLDSPEVYSPFPQEPNTFNHLYRDSMASAAWDHLERQRRPRQEGRSYMDPERISVHASSDTQSTKESPRYPPSVGDTNGKDANIYRTSREYRDLSSPPYSPPPPDIPEAPEPVSWAEPYISSLQTTTQDNQPTQDDGFICRICSFYVENNGQYKDKLCGSCATKATIRHNSNQILDSSTSSSNVSKEPAQLSSAPHTRLLHPNPTSAQPSSSKILDSINHLAVAKKSDISKNLGSEENPQKHTVAPVKQFQTSKDMVIERYRMTFPETQGNANPIIPTTNLTNLSKRKREEPVKPAPRRRVSICEGVEKGKIKAIMVSEKSTKSTNPAGPARKFPSKPASINFSPPTRTSRHISVDRPVTHDESVSSKKTERRGPAMKSAGQIFILGPDEDDNPVEDDNENRLKGLEEKLREQKGYTKKQMEKAVELQRKLMQSEKERDEMQEKQKKLEAILATSQKSVVSPSSKQPRKVKKLKRLVQLNLENEAGANGQLATKNHGSEQSKGPSLKDLYKDYKFAANNPWNYPAAIELPTPEPNTFRSQSWHKTPYRPWEDKAKLMNVHVHRQLTRKHKPVNIMAQPFLDGKSSHPAESSRSASLNDEADDDFRWPRGGNRTTFDAFMGIPDNMVPSVKEGFLGFRDGILNHRTRRLDRKGRHHKIRVPGVLMDKN